MAKSFISIGTLTRIIKPWGADKWTLFTSSTMIENKIAISAEGSRF